MAPEIPGNIIAETATAPDINIKKFVSGVLDGAWSAMYDEIISPTRKESKTDLLALRI